MNENSNIFLNKKILIYGLGKSGFSSFKFLKKKNKVFLFDDSKKINLSKKYHKNLISHSQIKKIKFDSIILSPGININKCKIKKYLKKNLKIIYTDLDVLATIRRSGEPYQLSPKQLMKSVLITSGAMTALLDRLTKLELISSTFS